MNKLTKKESYILRRVYGIGEKIETLNEIGEKMGLTRERVRQIKEKAIRKLRDALKLKKNNKEVSPEEEDPDDNGLTLEDIERKRKALKILEEYKKVIKSSTPSVLQLFHLKLSFIGIIEFIHYNQRLFRKLCSSSLELMLCVFP